MDEVLIIESYKTILLVWVVGVLSQNFSYPLFLDPCDRKSEVGSFIQVFRLVDIELRQTKYEISKFHE
jgi:hypothetical protein